MSDQPTVHELLNRVMADVTHVGKGDRNDFHKFMFRGIDRVINEVGPALRRHGVKVLPSLRTLESRDCATEKGKTAREVTVTVAYTFYGPSGDSLECVVPGEAQDVGDKAVSKAMSVAFRTALLQALTIPTDERDPDADSYNRVDVSVIAGWKNRIMAAAKERGWDVQALADDFAQWSQGEDIRTADEQALAEYHRYLKPRQKAQRAPVTEPGLPATTKDGNAPQKATEPSLAAS